MPRPCCTITLTFVVCVCFHSLCQVVFIICVCEMSQQRENANSRQCVCVFLQESLPLSVLERRRSSTCCRTSCTTTASVWWRSLCLNLHSHTHTMSRMLRKHLVLPLVTYAHTHTQSQTVTVQPLSKALSCINRVCVYI